jgi:hypothetical protein
VHRQWSVPTCRGHCALGPADIVCGVAPVGCPRAAQPVEQAGQQEHRQAAPRVGEHKQQVACRQAKEGESGIGEQRHRRQLEGRQGCGASASACVQGLPQLLRTPSHCCPPTRQAAGEKRRGSLAVPLEPT